MAFTVCSMMIVQWKPLNGIALGQRQIDSNKRIRIKEKLGIEEKFGTF
jgi:hypothetical protein